MRKILQAISFTAVLVSFCTAALAQYGPPGGPYAPDRVSALVEKVNADLNRGYSQWSLSKDDHKRLNKAENRLRDFAHDWYRAKFNKGALDDSISDIQHVLDKNRMPSMQRDALWSDIERLRQMREAYDHHEIGRW